MALEYLNTNVCLGFTFATFAAFYFVNTVKNNVANTIKAELDKAKYISLENYDEIVKEIGIITKCNIFVKILFLIAATHGLTTLYTFLYTNLNPSFLTKMDNLMGTFRIISFFYNGSEPMFLSFFVLCIIISLISIFIVFFSPRQNLLTANWNIPD